MANDGGLLLYMPEEGRNIGLLNKLRAYEFQFHNIDTIDANYALGFDADQRRHENAFDVLKFFYFYFFNIVSRSNYFKIFF